MFWLTNRSYVLLLLPVVLLTAQSCKRRINAAAQFGLDSLINAQPAFLASHHATLNKVAYMEGKSNDTTYVPLDSAAWKRELEIFTQLSEINKPINKDNYKATDSLFDVGSNLTVKEYAATKAGLPIRYLRIFYQDDIAKPRRIEALYDNENLLYANGKTLNMEFNQMHDRAVLTAYTINGGQKLVMSDSVVFSIKGKIVID